MATQSNFLHLVSHLPHREIKLRAWDRRNHRWVDPKLLACTSAGHLLIRATPNERYEISQFTGIRDKNGKEIYEGDIVRTGHAGCHILTWHKRGLWSLAPIGPSPDSPQLGLWEFCNLDLEIIGNQYENSESFNI